MEEGIQYCTLYCTVYSTVYILFHEIGLQYSADCMWKGIPWRVWHEWWGVLQGGREFVELEV